MRGLGFSPGATAATMPLIPLAPDTSTNVQAGYEHNRKFLGKARVVDSLASLPAAVGGVRQISEIFLQTCPSLILPADEQIEFIHPGGIFGFLHPKTEIVGDIAGPVVFGELVIDQTAIRQTNAAGSCFQMQSLAGRTVFLRFVDLRGVPGVFGGVVENALGAVTLDTVVCSGIPGLKLRNTIGGMKIANPAFLSAPANSIAIDIEASAAVGLGLIINDATMTSAAANAFFIRADNGAVFPTAAPPTSLVGVTVSRAQLTGTPILIDVDGGSARDEKAFDWIISASCFRGPTSAFKFEGSFADSASPAIQTWGLADTLEVVPRDNSVPGPLTTTFAPNLNLTQRFVEVVTGRQDWQEQFQGPTVARNGSVSWSATVQASAGTGTGIRAGLQTREILPAPTAWVDVPESFNGTTIRINEDSGIGGSSGVMLQPGTEHRLVASITNAGVDAEWQSFKIEIDGESV